jgi:branched-chain amino acid transport system permease protein
MMILSGDPPRGRLLIALLAFIVLALAAAPFLPSLAQLLNVALSPAKSLNVAATILTLALLVASYDLLLGYTGIVSFAHVMFYGVGAYGVAIALYGLGASWSALILGVLAALPVSVALALAIGLFSLRVQTIFFAMVTLAVASAFNVLASQLDWLTGGEDGRSFQVPEALRPGFHLIDAKVFGVDLNGRVVSYYLVFIACVALFLGLLRVVNSPFGRVLQAIRENPFRAEALGYRIVFHRTLATCISAAVATLAGALAAIWQHYVGPDTALSLSIQLDVLVMVVIGGMGSLYGAIAGAALFVIARNYLQGLLGSLSAAAAQAGLTLAAGLLHPDRWLMWLGLMFILAVYFVPAGIVGRLRKGGEGSV